MIFLMWPVFKVLNESVTMLLLFYFFVQEACGILAPWAGIEPISIALEDEVLTTGPPGKSALLHF